jgi:YidC/Oxa1 family membrane protein insertase
MDLQRSLLIGATAVLSFMLLTQWVAFKDAKTATTAQESSRLIVNKDEMPPSSTVADTKTVVSAAEDIPAAPSETTTEVTPPTTDAVEKDSIIRVYTDVLQLAVDLNGGDIVELSLAKYLEHLDNPKVPFVLLEDNDALIYNAQSGLIGPDGIDNNGRARFSATAPNFTLKEARIR